VTSEVKLVLLITAVSSLSACGGCSGSKGGIVIGLTISALLAGLAFLVAVRSLEKDDDGR